MPLVYAKGAPILINILNETSYAVFTFCRFSLFLKDPFYILFTCDHYIQSGLGLEDILTCASLPMFL